MWCNTIHAKLRFTIGVMVLKHFFSFPNLSAELEEVQDVFPSIQISTNNSGVPSPTVGPSALRVPSEARPRSGTSVTAETVVSLRTEIQTEHAPAQRVDQEGSVSEGQGNSSQSNGKTFF